MIIYKYELKPVTGQAFEGDYDHIGTVLTSNGLVWHVFEGIV